jgi:hypothetical protein
MDYFTEGELSNEQLEYIIGNCLDCSYRFTSAQTDQLLNYSKGLKRDLMENSDLGGVEVGKKLVYAQQYARARYQKVIVVDNFDELVSESYIPKVFEYVTIDDNNVITSVYHRNNDDDD